jgi:hypothetical protein
MRLLKIKPLTEEEKKQKLAELRDKMAEKRARKAAEEAEEAKANELIRRKAGKVKPHPSPSKPVVAHTYISTGNRAGQRGSKEQAAPKRPRSKAPRFVPPFLSSSSHPQVIYNASLIEKENDKKALAAIKAQIETDKRERAQKAAQEKALREGTATATTSVPAPAPAAAASAPATTSIPGREFKETRLQIRLASGGQPLTTTLPSNSSCVPYCIVSERFNLALIDCHVVRSFVRSGGFFLVSSARSGRVCCWSVFDGGCRYRHVHSAIPSVRCSTGTCRPESWLCLLTPDSPLLKETIFSVRFFQDSP